MQVTSMPGFSTQGEVSTSSGEQDSVVNSLGAAFNHALMSSIHKAEMEATTGECDTTQEDLDCHPHTVGKEIFFTFLFLFVIVVVYF